MSKKKPAPKAPEKPLTFSEIRDLCRECLEHERRCASLRNKVNVGFDNGVLRISFDSNNPAHKSNEIQIAALERRMKEIEDQVGEYTIEMFRQFVDLEARIEKLECAGQDQEAKPEKVGFFRIVWRNYRDSERQFSAARRGAAIHRRLEKQMRCGGCPFCR